MQNIVNNAVNFYLKCYIEVQVVTKCGFLLAVCKFRGSILLQPCIHFLLLGHA